MRTVGALVQRATRLAAPSIRRQPLLPTLGLASGHYSPCQSRQYIQVRIDKDKLSHKWENKVLVRGLPMTTNEDNFTRQLLASVDLRPEWTSLQVFSLTGKSQGPGPQATAYAYFGFPNSSSAKQFVDAFATLRSQLHQPHHILPPKAELLRPMNFMGRVSDVDPEPLHCRGLYIQGLKPVRVASWLKSADESELLEWVGTTFGRVPVGTRRVRQKKLDKPGQQEGPVGYFRGGMSTNSGFLTFATTKDAQHVMAQYGKIGQVSYKGHPIKMNVINTPVQLECVRHLGEEKQEPVGLWPQEAWRIVLEGERMEGCPSSLLDTVTSRGGFFEMVYKDVPRELWYRERGWQEKGVTPLEEDRTFEIKWE